MPVDEEENEGLGSDNDAATEDDPVDLAMRIAATDRLTMGGEEDDEDDEEIVYTSLNASAIKPHAVG